MDLADQRDCPLEEAHYKVLRDLTMDFMKRISLQKRIDAFLKLGKIDYCPHVDNYAIFLLYK